MLRVILGTMLAGSYALATPPRTDQGNAKWRAILEPVGGGTVRGGAMVEAKGGQSTRFTITIRNATPGATLAWHMHSGTCVAPGGVIGTGYPELRSGPGGTAEAAVTLSVAPPGSTGFIIQVHGPTGAPISCGDLKAIGENRP